MNLHRLFCVRCRCETIHRANVCGCGEAQPVHEPPSAAPLIQSIRTNGKARRSPGRYRKPEWAAR